MKRTVKGKVETRKKNTRTVKGEKREGKEESLNVQRKREKKDGREGEEKGMERKIKSGKGKETGGPKT